MVRLFICLFSESDILMLPSTQWAVPVSPFRTWQQYFNMLDGCDLFTLLMILLWQVREKELILGGRWWWPYSATRARFWLLTGQGTVWPQSHTTNDQFPLYGQSEVFPMDTFFNHLLNVIWEFYYSEGFCLLWWDVQDDISHIANCHDVCMETIHSHASEEYRLHASKLA